MKEQFIRILNWLDERVRPVHVPPFTVRETIGESGQSQVDIDNLKVWVYRSGDFWITQGLDIGYAASGKTLDQAKTNFLRGLSGTLIVNLQKHGRLDAVLRPAPPDVWLAWRAVAREIERDHQPHPESPAPDLFPHQRLKPIFFENCAAH